MTLNSIECVLLGSESEETPTSLGALAEMLQQINGLGIACSKSIALSFDDVSLIGKGDPFDASAILKSFPAPQLLSVLPSPGNPDWGGPNAFRDVGFNCDIHTKLAAQIGTDAADRRYCDHIQNFAEHVARLEPDIFQKLAESEDPVSAALTIFEEEAGEPFPQRLENQLAAVLVHMARAWTSVSARILRQALGAPGNAGLGLLLQDYSWSCAEGFAGAGHATQLNKVTGARKLSGSFTKAESLNSEGGDQALHGDTLQQNLCPNAFAEVSDILDRLRKEFRDELEIGFSVVDGAVLVTQAARPALKTRAKIRSTVLLAEDGIISRNDALMRVDPKSLIELLHATVDPGPKDFPIFSGVPASPGGASGHLVFSSAAAMQSVSNDQPCILARRETSPEDIRGLLSARGIVTERGGGTSHAAVIARGLGVPCVAGAIGIQVSSESRTLALPDGTIIKEGDLVTIDGSSGKVYAGVLPMREPSVDEGFRTLLSWADETRSLGVRANADTPDDAEQARRFDADGIGLCRTEHMFFEPSRIIVMREMIFAENETDRRSALDQLLPMQRSDFAELYKSMEGKPVCIRLFDPPLHEFLPTDREGQLGLAEALEISVNDVVKRVEALSECNPMLGLRGVRLGITVPEIYDMQVRAIMEAAAEASSLLGKKIVPEIMIPLVSTLREVSIVKKRLDTVATDIRYFDGEPLEYRLGVLLETPRAILRAEDIAEYAEILSFGTNDLTQLSFGVSRDDIGRFIGQYIEAGAFEVDPFNKLDMKGVGELIKIGAERGRAGRPNVVLTLCGEHAGEVEVIRFCESLGFQYVSCSPYRVPIAKLAAAQLTINND